MAQFSLAELETIIQQRARSGDPESWTAKLFAKGIDKAAQKLGEEAVETVIAAIRGDRQGLVSESADLLYHWLVVLGIAGVPLDEVLKELEGRTGRSGIAVAGPASSKAGTSAVATRSCGRRGPASEIPIADKSISIVSA